MERPDENAPANQRILVIEDDPNTQSFLSQGLEEAGYQVVLAGGAKSGLDLYQQGKWQLVILDIMLPDGDGLAVCRAIRATDTQVPILFLTAIGSPENIASGLDTGADDYLVKPFKFVELLARIRTLLRRTHTAPRPHIPEQLSRFADIVLDDYAKTVKRGDTPVTLTATEYKLLHLFLENPRKVISRTEILQEIWGTDVHMGSNVVDVYVNYLRKRLEVGGLPRLIHTVIGMGYVLKEADENQS